MTLTVSPDELAESASATDVTVTATLNGGTRNAATPVVVAVGSGTATSGTDFAAVSAFTITIPANALSQTGTFSLDPTQDTVDEPDETVAVDGSTTIDGLGVTDATVTITDDDDTPTVTLALSDNPISEDGGVSTVTASLDHASSVATTVTVSVAPDSPATSSDYTLSANKVLTIAANATASTGTVTVTAVDNDVDAADKTVQVRGSASNSVGITDPDDVELTLEDDDTRGVSLSASSLDVDEGDSGTYTVMLDTEPTASVTVTPSRSSGDTDVTVSGALTFTTANWSSAQTVTVSAAQDPDPDNDVAVIGHNVVGGDYASFVAGTVSVTVDDDETASNTVTLTASPDELAESANATEITVTATLNGGTRNATTPVVVAVGSGTATSGTDFAAVSAFTITIPANALSQTGTFSLDPTQDTVDEPDETVAVDGSTTVSGLSVTDTTVTITDDDDAPTVTLSLSDDPISEDGGVSTVTASLDHASSAVTTVTISVEPDSPATSSDYTLSANKVLTIAANATASTGTVTVTAVDNDVDAANKTVQVKGDASNTLGVTDPSNVSLTLEGDDTRGVTLSETELEIDEGDSGTYTVMLDTEPTASVTVTPSRSSGDTDVTVSGALTFTTANWNAAQTVTVSAAQDPDPDNDVAVIGHNVVGGDYASFVAGTVSVTVDDDETASNTVTLTASPDELVESASATTVTVTATLNGGTRNAATPVTVNVVSGTATSGTDFAPVSAFTITIPANAASHTGTFSLDPTQDSIDEPDETVAVDGSTTIDGLAVTDTTVRISDDDTRGVTLSRDELEIDEGESGTYTVVLDTEPTASVTVTPSRSSGDTDVTVSGALTFTTANWNAAQTVTVSAAQDPDPDDDTAEVGHTVSGGDYASFAAGSVSVTVGDDETASDSVTLTVSPDELAESASATDITVTATLNGGTRNAETPVVVTVGSGTATSGTDFSAVSAFTITIPANTQSQTGAFSLDPIQDTVDEPDETVAVEGSTTAGGYAVIGTVVGITDDDIAPELFLTLSDNPISENGGVTTVTVSLSHASSVVTTVTIAVEPTSSENAGDYEISGDNVLTIAPGTTESADTLTITGVDNSEVDGSRTFMLQAEATNSLAVGLMADQMLTIEDDDLQQQPVEDNNAPSGFDKIVETEEDSAYVFKADDFGFSDEDVSDSMESLEVMTLPGQGSLEIDDEKATAGQVISYRDIDSGMITFIPDPNDYGSPYADFNFKVSDGKEESEESNTITINVISVNDPATGKPTVSGSPELGETLFAHTSEIEDVDGLARVNFSYQWLRVENGQDVEIENAHGSAYAPGEADADRILKVKVSFTDDGSFTEELVSDPVGPVQTERVTSPGAPENMVANVDDGQVMLTWHPPVSDGGAEIIDYEIRFAQGLSIPVETAWQSAGVDLGEEVSGLSNGHQYTFAVRAINSVGSGPTASTSAELPMPAQPPGAPLDLSAEPGSRQVILKWQPPENDGRAEIIDYEYRFSEGPGIPAAVTWRSAGPDLGETVTGLQDDRLYAFEVRAVNSAGPGPAAVRSARTQAVRKIDGALIEGWLARFGRTASGDTAEAIRQRLEEGPQRTELVVGGRDIVRLFAPREESVDEPHALMRLPESGDTAMDRMRFGAGASVPAGQPYATAGYDIGFEVGMENGRVTSAGIGNRRSLPSLRDLLLRSSFYHEFAANEGSSETEQAARPMTFWGSASGSRFDASIDSMRLDGEVNTGTMGFDRHWGQWLTGLALSHSEGEGRFQDRQTGAGVIGGSLTGIYPYAYLQVDRRTSFWGTFGFGKGEMQFMPDDTDDISVTDLGNTMAAFGGRGVLSIREGANGRFELALRSDALLTNTASDAGAILEETEASTRRLRLMLEATGTIESDGLTLSPTFEAGFRHDAGDAEQGTGFEIGGGLAWSAGPLTLQLNGRSLLAHKDDAYREWGYSAGVQYQPGERGRGLLLNLTSTKGSNQGGAERLWSMPDAGGLARQQVELPGQSIRFELGYGLESAWRRALWHPYLGVETFAGEGRALRLGFRISAGERIDAGLEFGRRISGLELPLDTVQLRGTIRW